MKKVTTTVLDALYVELQKGKTSVPVEDVFRHFPKHELNAKLKKEILKCLADLKQSRRLGFRNNGYYREK